MLQVITALDELESTGSLQHSNQIDISDLLNPADEAHFLSSTSDEDIFNAVMENKQAQEKGASDCNAIEEHLVDPIPTCAEAHRAALTLSH